LEDLKEIGQKEKNAVLESDFVVVILPGGKGTHIELGIALGQGKKYMFIHQMDQLIILNRPVHFINYLKLRNVMVHLMIY
jgi:predicted Rossmann-fold nucleotide-binding protein